MSSKFPEAWKRSIVVPLPKIKTPKYASDMRPISLIPLPGKIMEHLISFRFKDYLDRHNILTSRQHGFRKSHSTITAMTSLLHNIYKNLNIKRETYLVYLDLRKAFDTVSHVILTDKLGNIGLDSRTVAWFSSYLTNRSQYVKFNNKTSSVEHISYGVPQGSVLSPTLFSLYINDIVDVVGPDKLLLYADDTVVYETDTVILQNILNQINVWCDENLLTINCKKSQWMRTNLVKAYNDDVAFHLGNQILDKVHEYKYLGLIMDSDLNFQTHRDTLQKRINYKLLFFRKIRKFINVRAAVTIYKSTILPIIEYADFVYDCDIKYNNKKLQSLQNQGLYTVFDQYVLPYQDRKSTETLHRDAKLYRLTHRRRLHLLSYAFYLTKNSIYIDNRNIPTRNHEAILFRVIKLDHFKCYQDPLYLAMSEWNRLNVEIRRALTKCKFLNLVKAQIVNPYEKIL